MSLLEVFRSPPPANPEAAITDVKSKKEAEGMTPEEIAELVVADYRSARVQVDEYFLTGRQVEDKPADKPEDKPADKPEDKPVDDQAKSILAEIKGLFA